jgi:hypothetical protein
MNDAFLFLTPLLLLPVVALLGFVGCNQVFGLEPTDIAPPGPPPTNLVATAGDGRVDLTWDPYANASKYRVKRGEMSGDHPNIKEIDASQATYADTTDVINGTTYYYVVSALLGTTETEDSEEKPAMPMNPNEDFVTSFVVGTSANTFSGWAGMEFTISTNSLNVFAVGRVHAPGDVQKHTIKIIEKSTLTDVVSVVVDSAGGTDGQMQTAPFPGPVMLKANTTYYIVSQETAGGTDHVYMDDSTVLTTGAATVSRAISGDGVTYSPGTPGNHCFGPLTFQYMLI